MFKLEINLFTGAYNCFRCQAQGYWEQFKRIIRGEVSSSDVHQVTLQDPQTFISSFEYSEQYNNLISDKEEIKEKYSKSLEYLTKKEGQCRHLDFEVLKKYKVGLGYEQFAAKDGTLTDVPVAYFPMFVKNQQTNSNQDIISDENYTLARVKVRGLGKHLKQYMRLKPTGKIFALFGLNTVPIDAKEVIITEGEYDAMAAYQATNIPAISLPNGANHLPKEVIPFLNQFEKIYLWMDNDQIGKNITPKIAEKLGKERTYIVKSKCHKTNQYPKDANDALRMFKDDYSTIQQFIKDAKLFENQYIADQNDLNKKVVDYLIYYDKNSGIKTKSMFYYNKQLGGLRFGELTVLSGPTGSGKTSFLSQLSVELAQKGVGTLWGSFEIKNEILKANMLQQYIEKKLTNLDEEYIYKLLEQYDLLPLNFLDFHGEQDLDKVIESIKFAVKQYNIQHVIIDNLQFVIGNQKQGYEYFAYQDRVISNFRNLATQENIHVTIVIHPKKVSEQEDLDLSSIFGGAKATQEADNVIIIQKREYYRVLDIRKNRHNGGTGQKALMFQTDCKRFFEVDHEDIKKMNNGKMEFKEVFKKNLQEQIQKLQIIDQNNLSKNNDGDDDGNDNDNEGNDGNNNEGNGGSDNNNQGNNNEGSNDNGQNNTNVNNSQGQQNNNSQINNSQTQNQNNLLNNNRKVQDWDKKQNKQNNIEQIHEQDIQMSKEEEIKQSIYYGDDNINKQLYDQSIKTQKKFVTQQNIQTNNNQTIVQNENEYRNDDQDLDFIQTNQNIKILEEEYNKQQFQDESDAVYQNLQNLLENQEEQNKDSVKEQIDSYIMQQETPLKIKKIEEEVPNFIDNKEPMGIIDLNDEDFYYDEPQDFNPYSEHKKVNEPSKPQFLKPNEIMDQKQIDNLINGNSNNTKNNANYNKYENQDFQNIIGYNKIKKNKKQNNNSSI